MPLKNEFKREEVIIVETKKQRNAASKKTGLADEIASFRSLRFTFVKTRYKDKPLIPNFRMSLTMLHSLFFSIKYSSNLIRFSVCTLKIGTNIYFC